MRLQLSKSDQTFADEVDAFIARHWRAPAAGVNADIALASWRAALVQQGWYLVGWPVAAGGPGWNATRRFIWARACAAAGAPPVADAGVAVVGPLLLEHRGLPLSERWLSEITDSTALWCVAWPVAGSSTPTARALRDGHVVDGVLPLVADALTADWMLCAIARDQAHNRFDLFAVDLADDGVVRSKVESWGGGGPWAQVSCNAAAGWRVLANLDESALQEVLQGAAGAVPGAVSGMCEAQVRVLVELLQTDDDALRSQLHEAQVELEGLRAMELRYTDALERGVEPPMPVEVLWQRGRQLLLALGELQVSALGYYALPFPDTALLHNEGPVGPVGATNALRHTLGRQIALQYENSLQGSDRLDGLKDRIARRLEQNKEDKG